MALESARMGPTYFITKYLAIKQTQVASKRDPAIILVLNQNIFLCHPVDQGRLSCKIFKRSCKILSRSCKTTSFKDNLNSSKIFKDMIFL